MWKYKILDCFCWIGGFSRWFMDEGFDVEYWIDIWDVALDTYKSFHPWVKTKCSDISEIEDEFFSNLEWKIDVIIWWPPCQWFSMSWKRENGDKRNDLFLEMVRATKLVKPKIVVIENVVWLLSMKDKEWKYYKDIIIKNFNDIGYNVKYETLNASEYWVPQQRKRVFFVISKNVDSFKYPKKELKTITVLDALSNIPKAWQDKYLPAVNDFQLKMSQGNKDNMINNHQKMLHRDLIVKRMSYVPQGWNWRDIPLELWQWWGTHSNNYKRLDETKPSITLKHATKSMIIHPWHDRCLTPREVARLQSFPDSLVLYWAKFEQHQQLANAVPPILSQSMGKSVKSFLNYLNNV